MLRVAILGANGFIGSRTVEIVHLEGLAEIRPVVRSYSSLARSSRFDLDCRIANALDLIALRAAFTGCDVVVHAVAGDPKTIVGTVGPVYQAAQQAGVRRLVYLSTASVHGQNPSPGTDENSALSDRQLLSYNNAKVQAERKLLQLRNEGNVELVMLRPGIVFGPRSYWVTNFVDDLLAGNAYLINEGKGICNTIYIDNLVHAIFLAMTAPASAIDGHAFLVGDEELLTWWDFYCPIAEALGLDLAEISHFTFFELSPDWQDRLEELCNSRIIQAVLLSLPDKLKRSAKAALSAWKASSTISPWALPEQKKKLFLTQEMTLLYQCQYKLPFKKANQILKYTPIISFPEACLRTVAWLAFVNYPVVDHCRRSTEFT